MTRPPMKARDLLREAIDRMKAAPAIDHWQRNRERIEAEDLLGFACGGEEPEPDDDISAAVARRFRAMIDRRVTGEPTQYIKGITDFRGLELVVRRGVFVPRDSSEFLAVQAIRRLHGRRKPVHVDLACGGGPVALAVANEVSRVAVYASDLSEDAVRVARLNASRLRLR